MLLVLMVIATVVVMSFGLVAAMGTSGQMASNVIHREQARAIARSGLSVAVKYVETDANWRSKWSTGVWVQDGNVAGGKCTISADMGSNPGDVSSPVTLTAVGTISGASFTAQAVVTPTASTISQGVTAAANVRIDGWGSVLDSYDSSKGAYGGSNAGSSALVTTNSTSSAVVQVTGWGQLKGSVAVGPGGNTGTAIYKDFLSTITGTRTALSAAEPMPTPTAPTNMGSSTGNLKFSGGVTNVISGNLHLDSLEIKHSARVQIQGNVTILVEGTVSIHDSTTWLEVLPGASLKIYHRGALTIDGAATCNIDGANLSRMQFINLGSSAVTIDAGSTMEGVILSPNGPVTVQNGSVFCGAAVSSGLSIYSGADFHQDLNITTGKDAVTQSAGGGYTVRFVEKF